MRRPRPVIRAFTLVELLVVIGIIAVLIGVLLPVLSRAQRQTRITVCLSNQRQLMMALQMYCQENKNTFPGGSGFTPTRDLNGNPQPPSYHLKLADYDTNVFNPYSCNTDEQSGPTWLAKYVKNSKKIPACPEELGIKETGTSHLAYRTGYWYPLSLVYQPKDIWSGAAATGALVQVPQKTTSVRYPAQKVVIIDRKTYHSKVVHDTDKTPDGVNNNTRKVKTYVTTGFADGHADFRGVFDMFDSDVNWTGRGTPHREAGVLGRDFR